MTYTNSRPAYLPPMTVRTESPIRRQTFDLTERQAEAWARVQEGGRFTHRELEERLGYSNGGVTRFVAALRNAGLMRVYTARGRFGCTVLRPIPGARIVSGLRSFKERLDEALAAWRERAPQSSANVRGRTDDDHSRPPYEVEPSPSTSANIRPKRLLPISSVLEAALSRFA